MQVFVKTLSGKTFSYDVSGNDVVEVLKRQIQDKEGIPQDSQRLIFAGKPLNDGQMLCAYGVRRDSTLHLVISMRGGHSITGISFSDVSKPSNVRKAHLSPIAPLGRTVSLGTNIECRCDCTPGYLVICGQGYGCIEVSTTSFKCPNCRRSDQLIPVTVGFLCCKYRFRGTKATGEKYVSDWVTVTKDDLYQVFVGGDRIVWYRLEVESVRL